MDRLFRVVRILFVVTALMISFSSRSAYCEGRVCPAVALSSAALASNGELGIGHAFELAAEPSFQWSRIRTESDPTACFVAEAKAMMKAACAQFLAQQENAGTQPATSACAVEREALDLSANENLRLKRIIRRLKAKLNRQ